VNFYPIQALAQTIICWGGRFSKSTSIFVHLLFGLCTRKNVE